MNVYLLLTDTGTVFNTAIKKYTRKPYNHASLALDQQLSQVYSFARKKVYNPFIGGFVQEDVTEHLLNEASCEIYCLTVTPLQYEQLQMILKQFERNKEQYKYNLLGVLAIPLRRDIYRENAYFCSQFVAYALGEAGISLINKSTHLITPDDFRQCEQVELVYEGTVQDYLIQENPAFGLVQEVTLREALHNFYKQCQKRLEWK
ncbi:hypothetical protein JTF06_11305 [Desemzia sp. RIT804]|uniref:hypothetical protein n=1 Tax=Desemzia sp. RIT 804 TaxID=2810209 RepID=UPI00194DD80B|nr:hypothetical protein [Desemzia sp. RIT 804]MBM6615478.1 hypothetical protein [Desemzia sp. RIT 804]